MNKKEYTLLAKIIRTARGGAGQLYKGGASQAEIEATLRTIKAIQSILELELVANYDNFDLDKFRESCKI